MPTEEGKVLESVDDDDASDDNSLWFVTGRWNKEEHLDESWFHDLFTFFHALSIFYIYDSHNPKSNVPHLFFHHKIKPNIIGYHNSFLEIILIYAWRRSTESLLSGEKMIIRESETTHMFNADFLWEVRGDEEREP